MKLSLRIYYEDTDFSGFVYHARYLHFFERARTEALRDMGVDQRTMYEAEGGPFAFVVRHISVDYIVPACMDDIVVVETTTSDITAASVIMRQVLKRGDEVLARAEATIVHLRKGKPARFDPALKQAFIALQ